MVKKLLTILIASITVSPEVFGDQYVFENQSSSSIASNNIPTQIDINRTFITFAEAVAKLNSIGFSCVVVNNNAQDPINQQVKYSGNPTDVVGIIAKKFNYKVQMNGSNVVFTAMYPPQPKVIESTPLVKNTVSDSAIQPLGVEKTPTPSTNWSYSINDKYISTTLNNWAKLAGYQVIWQSDNDYEVQSNGSLNGMSFKAAVNEILKSFRNTDHPLKAEWYKNNVVVISNFGG